MEFKVLRGWRGPRDWSESFPEILFWFWLVGHCWVMQKKTEDSGPLRLGVQSLDCFLKIKLGGSSSSLMVILTCIHTHTYCLHFLYPGSKTMCWRHAMRNFTIRNRDSHSLIFQMFLFWVKELVSSDITFWFLVISERPSTNKATVLRPSGVRARRRLIRGSHCFFLFEGLFYLLLFFSFFSERQAPLGACREPKRWSKPLRVWA